MLGLDLSQKKLAAVLADEGVRAAIARARMGGVREEGALQGRGVAHSAAGECGRSRNEGDAGVLRPGGSAWQRKVRGSQRKTVPVDRGQGTDGQRGEMRKPSSGAPPRRRTAHSGPAATPESTEAEERVPSDGTEEYVEEGGGTPECTVVEPSG